LPLPPDAAFIVMEDATIAHECSPLGRGNDLTKWIHTILSGHRHTCFNGSTANSVHFCFLTQATCLLMASFSSGKLFLDIPGEPGRPGKVLAKIDAEGQANHGPPR
jgi:hypothetical protein